jgi:hypothetical protein
VTDVRRGRGRGRGRRGQGAGCAPGAHTGLDAGLRGQRELRQEQEHDSPEGHRPGDDEQHEFDGAGEAGPERLGDRVGQLLDEGGVGEVVADSV